MSSNPMILEGLDLATAAVARPCMTAGNRTADRYDQSAPVMSDTPSSARLVLACLRRRGGDVAEILGRLSHDADWDRMTNSAEYLGVAPLLYATVKTMDGVAVPADVMGRLARSYYEQAAVNGQLFAALRRILEAFAGATIPVMVLKGAAIAERVYGNIALRPMKDLDLLVRSHDLAASDRLLRQLGYTPDESEQAAEWFGDHHHHWAPYCSRDGRVVIELHHHIITPNPAIPVPIDDLWRRARPFVGGGAALALCPEDLLLHLCLHASLGHQFALGLRPMCDIAQTLRHYGAEIAWPQIRDRASQWAVGKYVYLALRLARDLVDAPVPVEMLESLQPHGFDRNVVVWATAQIFADDRQVSRVSSRLARLHALRRPNAKAAFVLSSAVPSPKIMARLYPASSNSKRLYLYYPVRWWDLFRRYGRSAGRLLRRDETIDALVEREYERTVLNEWLTPARSATSHRTPRRTS